jgi:hypothetical protein
VHDFRMASIDLHRRQRYDAFDPPRPGFAFGTICAGHGLKSTISRPEIQYVEMVVSCRWNQ